MNRFFVFVFVLLLSAANRAQLPSADSPPTEVYKPPHAHSSGADLLYYCEQTDRVVDQLRCDYYVQGVADMASLPRQDEPLACVRQGTTRSELIMIALDYLKTVNPNTLETKSAASLILQSFRKTFPCPKNIVPKAAKKPAPIKYSPAMQAVFRKCTTAGDKEAIGKCLKDELQKLKEKAPK